MGQLSRLKRFCSHPLADYHSRSSRVSPATLIFYDELLLPKRSASNSLSACW